MLVLGRNNSKVYIYNALAFFCSFLVFRVLLNTIMIYWVGRAFYLTTKGIGVIIAVNFTRYLDFRSGKYLLEDISSFYLSLTSP